MAMHPGWRGTAFAVVMALALGVSACSMFGKNAAKSGEEAEDDIAAEEPFDKPRSSVLDLLDDEELDAVERSGISGPLIDRHGESGETNGPFSRERRDLENEPESKSDKAGKLGISVLSVALSAAAVAAPFFLF